MRQRVWLLHWAAMLAALCCGLNDAAAKPSTIATVSAEMNSCQGYSPLSLYSGNFNSIQACV